MSSPPPTPSPTIPDGSQWRFHEVGTRTEWIERYRPGGFHPVHIGDLFNNSRYRVLRKLGYGSFSTVWLAKDQSLDTFVALKVLAASGSSQSHEVAMYLYESRNAMHCHPGRAHLVTLLDSFEHHGPNGTHTCLVLELLGPNAGYMVELLPENQPRKWGRRARYPPWIAKSMLRQTLLGLAYLHEMGIVHGDLQPGNLLFSLSSRGVKSLSGRDLSHDARLLQGTGPEDISEPVRRFDGKQDLWAPKYLSLNKPLAEFSEITSDFTLKLSDLGGAFFQSSQPEEILTPAALRAPELIVGGKVTTSLDIWSFGCLVFEFLTGTPLFAIWKSPWCDEHEADDDHLLQLSEILGPLPSFLLSRWARSNIYFNANGENIKNYIGVLPEGYSENDDRFTFLNLEDSFGEGKPAHIRPEEQKEIIALLRYILQYDQKLRPSAAELLRHPWFERQQDE